jgi:hypothetical protein
MAKNQLLIATSSFQRPASNNQASPDAIYSLSKTFTKIYVHKYLLIIQIRSALFFSFQATID